jgi:t-SNARE complex subunit (syntaxin)
MNDFELKQINYNSKEDLLELEELKKIMNDLHDLNELHVSIQNMLVVQNENISKVDTIVESSETKIQNVNIELSQAQNYQRGYLSKMKILLMAGVLSVVYPLGFFFGAKVAIATGIVGGSSAILYTESV